jgi:DNA mismatch repair protein MSH3
LCAHRYQPVVSPMPRPAEAASVDAAPKAAGAAATKADRVHLALVAVDPSSGHVRYDAFADAGLRGALETRLAHWPPSELVLPAQLSFETEQIIHHALIGHGVRITRLPPTVSAIGTTMLATVSAFFTTVSTTSLAATAGGAAVAGAVSSRKRTLASTYHDVDAADVATAAKRPSLSRIGGGHDFKVPHGGVDMLTVLQWPEPLIASVGVLIEYLEPFGLASVLRGFENYATFDQDATCTLDGAAVANLDVIVEQGSGQLRGSLLWLLDQTRTPFGARRLRDWVLRPLRDRAAIERRQAAVARLAAPEQGEHYMRVVCFLLILC